MQLNVDTNRNWVYFSVVSFFDAVKIVIELEFRQFETIGSFWQRFCFDVWHFESDVIVAGYY